MLEISFTMKPMTPIMIMPIDPVFMYVHISSRLGLPTSLISLLQEDRNDLIPTLTLPTDQHSTSMCNPSFNFTVIKRPLQQPFCSCGNVSPVSMGGLTRFYIMCTFIIAFVVGSLNLPYLRTTSCKQLEQGSEKLLNAIHLWCDDGKPPKTRHFP